MQQFLLYYIQIHIHFVLFPIFYPTMNLLMEYILTVMEELLSDYFHSKKLTLGKTECAINKGQHRDTGKIVH